MNLNNSIFIFLITLFIPATLLLADIDVNNYGSEDIKEPTKQSPFSLTFSSDAIGQSKIQHGYFKGDELRFGEVTAEASAVFYYCPTHEEGASVSLSYTYTSFEWPQNLWFDQDHFNTAALSLTGFSHRLCRWFWIGQATVNVDADQWNFNTYAYYDLLLWGRYAYFENFGLNIGLFVQTGMRTDRLYPVIGIDWQISKRWKLNLVYPLNISLEYRLNNMWSVALAGRNFNYRYRVGPHECFSHSIIRYQNVGAEFAVNYQKGCMTANLHAGTTLGGKFRIADRHNHHPKTFDLDSAPYAGGEVVFKF